MRLLILALLAVLFFSPATYGQAASSDTKTLQAILEEVRQLRQDLHSTAATVQKAQILLYKIRIQSDTVSRLSQRLEDVRDRLQEVKSVRAQNAARIKTIEDSFDQTQDAVSRKRLEDELSARKNQAEQISVQEQDLETKESEQSSQLRQEQAKLDDMQASLDQLEKVLENTAKPSGTPH
jgi:chromosome segregation ATPase